MSILEKDKIDGIGIHNNENKVMLMLSDHLGWEHEYEHLIMLQEKINAYISFIESGQVKEIYPEINSNHYVIEIHFKYAITERCSEFLNAVNKQLDKVGISITTELP